MVHFIDFGGNIGQSVEYALDKYKNDELKIDTFEPLPMNLEELNKFKDNPIVDIHANAAWINDETKKFYVQNWGARTGSSLIEGKSSTKIDEYIDVKCIDVVDWLSKNLNLGNKNIVKIDIEGAEYKVIEHLLDHQMDEYIDTWLIEWTPHAKVPHLDKKYVDNVKDNFLSRGFDYVDWSFHY